MNKIINQKKIPLKINLSRLLNFIPIHKNQTKLKTNYFKEKFFLKKEKKFKLVLYCGSKNYEKGAISILKSIPYILKKIKKVYFVLIGPATKAYKHELSKIQKLKFSR